ncbi:MAG: PIN domain-containing protein [Candidatus Gottesmanbacteria bacterium]|nr:PIN domain-containing protein [Candidatus Gottesmanbacteria bacterium]
MSARNGEQIVFIDTNIFLRVLVKENERMFRECKGILALISKGDVVAYTNTIVLTEIQFVLTSIYKETREKIGVALESVCSIAALKIIDDTDAHGALFMYGKTNVKFSDCLIASSKRIQSESAVVLSYDRDFDKLGVRRVEPKQLLK